jgi:hypothetical protein
MGRLRQSSSEPSLDFLFCSYSTVTMRSNGWFQSTSADLLLTPSFIYQSLGLKVKCGPRISWPKVRYDRNLVDPASSHMLVSKIKPCMSKYKHFVL